MPQSGNARRRALLSATTAVTALGAFALAAPPANAAETSVPCDSAALVDAITAANASSEPDVLSLAPNCVYTLTSAADPRGSGLPENKGKLTINGNHATIARAKDAPQFRIISNWGDLTLNEVTITGGHAPDGVGTSSYGNGTPGGRGGGIENWGPLTITNSVVTGNSAGAGAPGADGTAAAPQPGLGGFGGSGGGISSYASGSAAVTITDSRITGNISGAGGRGGNGAAKESGGTGGWGGFGGGVDISLGIALRITGSTISDNIGADGGRGGDGGPDGGRGGGGNDGGLGAGITVATQQSGLLSPVLVNTKISGNRAGNGGDSGAPGPGGYAGYPGNGGSGGGLTVFYDTLTVDSGSITDNTVGEPGAGSYPYPASGGGIYVNSGHVTLANGAVVTGNRPDNCYPVTAITGCANGLRALAVQRTGEIAAQNRHDAELAVAARAASLAASAK